MGGETCWRFTEDPNDPIHCLRCGVAHAPDKSKEDCAAKFNHIPAKFTDEPKLPDDVSEKLAINHGGLVAEHGEIEHVVEGVRGPDGKVAPCTAHPGSMHGLTRCSCGAEFCGPTAYYQTLAHLHSVRNGCSCNPSAKQLRDGEHWRGCPMRKVDWFHKWSEISGPKRSLGRSCTTPVSQ